MDAVRTQPDRLHDLPDRAGLDQLTGSHGRADLETLAVTDRVNASGLRLHAARLRQLFERREAGLVAHVVFAVLHDPDAERRAFAGDGGADHQLDRLVVEDFLLARCQPRLWEALREGRGQLRLGGVEGHQCRARIQHQPHLAVNVGVVYTDDGEANR